MRVLFVAAATLAAAAAGPSRRTTSDLFAPATTSNLFARYSASSERGEQGESDNTGGGAWGDYDFRGRGETKMPSLPSSAECLE